MLIISRPIFPKALTDALIPRMDVLKEWYENEVFSHVQQSKNPER
jgi:hypothetical protein